MPRISYRYAIFEGDDAGTAANEAFDGLFTGFYDWGAWWQGEIAGEYFVSNSNLISHQLRVHVTPRGDIATGLMLYDFQADEPASSGVTSDDVARELDWYMDGASTTSPSASSSRSRSPATPSCSRPAATTRSSTAWRT